jgi:hypothetical protein
VTPTPHPAPEDRDEPAKPLPYAVAYEMARRLVREATLAGVAMITRAADDYCTAIGEPLPPADPSHWSMNYLYRGTPD